MNQAVLLLCLNLFKKNHISLSFLANKSCAALFLADARWLWSQLTSVDQVTVISCMADGGGLRGIAIRMHFTETLTVGRIGHGNARIVLDSCGLSNRPCEPSEVLNPTLGCCSHKSSFARDILPMIQDVVADELADTVASLPGRVFDRL